VEFKHKSVLLNECIEQLNIKPEGTYVDCTTGGGGHSLEIAKKLTTGRLICLDQDTDALKAAGEKLKDYKDKITFVNDNFSNFKNIMENLNIDNIDGALLDIGVSSYQIDRADRGFSYMQDGNLDMRMDQSQGLSAWDVVNKYSERDLSDIFYKYGEEKWSKRIAEFIVEARREKSIDTTQELVDIISKAIPKKVRLEMGGHFAKRVFQAIRIEVNKELEVIENVIPDIVECLAPKGRICIITFHSLEDRIVKNEFKKLNRGCICPPDIPICVCNHKKTLKIITRKPIEPSEQEKEENSRSRSAKLRVGEKLK